MKPKLEMSPKEPAAEPELTKVQKLAALLLMLDPESATQIIKRLKEDELAAVAHAMTEFTLIDQEMQTEVLQEFSGLAVSTATAVAGGVDQALRLLEKGIGLFNASEIMARISPSPPAVAAMDQLAEMEARHLFNLLRNEQPQSIALVVCYLAPKKASQILSLMRPELREQVIRRLGTMSPVCVDALEKVIEILQPKLRHQQSRALDHRDGPKMAAQVLNSLDRSLSKAVLLSIEERDPELGQAIRLKMFTFEDLAGVDSLHLQRIMQEVNKNDLAVALKGISQELQDTFLSCLSKRAAESVREEIQFLPPVKLRDIEAARSAVIEIARRLEKEGEIELGKIQPSSPFLTAA